MLRSGSWPRLVLSGVVAFLTAAHSEIRADDLKLPDPSTGSINGRVALLYWPVLPTADPNKPRLLPPEGCWIHLVPLDDPTTEHRYACGKWFQPPIDGYNAWLETADRISAPWVVRYGGGPSAGGLAALVPVYAAGRVGIPPERSIVQGEELRILSLESRRTTRSGRIFERRVRREDAGNPVLMPAGRIVAGRFEQKSGAAIALSRPAAVEPGRTTRVWPVPPANGSDLLVILRKPSRTDAADDTTLSVDDGERTRGADICLDVNRIVGIWYGLEPLPVTISLHAKKVTWPHHQVRLAAGRVSTVRAQAERLPKLGVSVTAPDSAILQDPIPVTIRSLADDRLVTTGSMVAGDPHQFEDLPPELCRVTITVGAWRFFEDVDLTQGNDREVAFELEPITITGTVFLGKDPVAAELRFHNNGEWVSVRSDDAGRYRATVWHPGYYTLRIATTDGRRAPFTQHFTAIEESGNRDFHLPRTDYRLTVHDANTAAPVAGARVSIGNVWRDEANVEQSLLDSAITDDSGTIALPPLRPGRLLLTVRAEGYGEGTLEQMVLQDDSERRELTMPLRRVRASKHLRLLAASGEPLSGAEIWAFAGDDFHVPVWQATTGTDGDVEVPDQIRNAVFLVRHPNVASVARSWDGAAEDLSEWRMEAPAPPLNASVTRPNGDRARSARMAIWLDGVRLDGVPLAFTTWSSPSTDMDGRWTARNLPRRSTRLLALPLGSSSSIESRNFDAMSATILFPWTVPASVTTVE